MNSVNVFTEENFENEVINASETVLVDFYADWCGPCKMMSPIIDEIAEEGLPNIKVGKVNVDNCQDLAVKYNVMSIPTIAIFKNGQIVNSFIGVTDKESIKEAMK